MKRVIVLMVLGLAAAGLGVVANAHECDYEGPGREEGEELECRETAVQPNWRDGNYMPLFDLEDRNDPDQRRDAQRWRAECGKWDAEGNYEGHQMCVWMYGGFSVFPNRDGSTPSPNEWHVGFAASHCFLMEAAHQCEDHDATRGEGVHDAHGGATYVDICLTENPESKYCKDGLQGTQVGNTIMDHNGCGVIVPIVACTDEYWIIKPFDPDFTMRQMENSAEYMQRILADPELYLCGYRERRGSGNAICPREGDSIIPPSPFADDDDNGNGNGNAEGDAASAELKRALQTVAAGELLAAGARPDAVLAAYQQVVAPTSAAPAGSQTGWAGLLLILLLALGARARRLITIG